MKVLLTGAMGNIGFSTLEALVVEGHDIVAFDLESRRARKLASASTGECGSYGATSLIRNRCERPSRVWTQ
jgi:nucleoside-diphosphate-sugar epimerase